MSRTVFYGPKDVRTIEVRLYILHVQVRIRSKKVTIFVFEGCIIICTISKGRISLTYKLTDSTLIERVQEFPTTDTDAQRGKRSLMSYANSESSDQHEHPCSLILAFSVC